MLHGLENIYVWESMQTVSSKKLFSLYDGDDHVKKNQQIWHYHKLRAVTCILLISDIVSFKNEFDLIYRWQTSTAKNS